MIFNIDPIPKPRMTHADRWKKRPVVLRYRCFCDELRSQAMEEGFEIGEKIEMNFYIAMPKSWSKKKKNLMLGKPHQQKPDLDNLIKTIDCLCDEDEFIYQINATKKWAEYGHLEIRNL